MDGIDSGTWLDVAGGGFCPPNHEQTGKQASVPTQISRNSILSSPELQALLGARETALRGGCFAEVPAGDEFQGMTCDSFSAGGEAVRPLTVTRHGDNES